MRVRSSAFVALVALALAAPTAAAERELRLEGFNRVYTDLVGGLAPFGADPLTLRLSSPSQTVLVRENVARLVPLGDGRAEGSLEVELLGKGRLVALLELAGRESRFEDDLILPPQRIRLEGAVRIARVEGGYRILAERAPDTVEVEIRSQLANRLVSTCEAAALLSFGALDCAPVTAALERPRVPLPAAGHEFFLSDADLDDGDRAELDALIAAR
jgi:hypothetical protein